MNKRDLILVAIGEASMCWNETPTGVFDTERAIAIANRLEADLDRYDEEAHTEHMANLALEAGDI